jgi:hypothetical protein
MPMARRASTNRIDIPVHDEPPTAPRGAANRRGGRLSAPRAQCQGAAERGFTAKTAEGARTPRGVRGQTSVDSGSKITWRRRDRTTEGHIGSYGLGSCRGMQGHRVSCWWHRALERGTAWGEAHRRGVRVECDLRALRAARARRLEFSEPPCHERLELSIQAPEARFGYLQTHRR